MTVAEDGRSASIAVGGLRPGRVYSIHLNGVKSADGDAILHADAYYTLNDLQQSV